MGPADKIKNMPKEYTQEQLWQLYENLPEKLKGAVFSEKTADNTFDICTRNGLKDKQISEVARLVGRVLLGIVREGDFQKALAEMLKIETPAAKKISQEINRLIFFQLKDELNKFYSP